jgi:hypothetical protein
VFKYLCLIYVDVCYCSLEEKEKGLDNERKAKLNEWNVKLGALQRILQDQETAFKQREGIATDLETVRFKRSEMEVILFSVFTL